MGRRYEESGDGFRVKAWHRGNTEGHYTIDVRRPMGLTPRDVDELCGALKRAQVALADRMHPAELELRRLGP